MCIFFFFFGYMNFYHRNDVVAYRIRPLLMPKGETLTQAY